MSEWESPYHTTPIQPADAKAGFACGNHSLDDFFARHAVANDAAGVCRVYVRRREADDDPSLPGILGFYTLSMASAEAAPVAQILGKKLPNYAMPVALIGRLAIDQRVQGRGLGEKLLLDALRRVVTVAANVGCTGVVVDAKDEGATRFYANYGFVVVVSEGWPRRMFLPISVARDAFAP
ncbi:MAG: GNAT family N-acetyltransferase [Myxococcota bacterium]|nr:GNAT family N-acetyltransferase [Myxococcota bacterium]